MNLGYILAKTSTAAAGVVLYLPVVAGIITPMLWMLPAWYVSWYALSYIVPFSSTWSGILYVTWAPVSSSLSTMVDVAFWLFGLATFAAGSGLFLYALATMVRARSSTDELITSGPYRWVRHPQHLGIILMLALPTLHIYGFHSDTFRFGDLVSVSSLIFLLVLVADIEEIGLFKKFGDGFLNYHQSTPFMLPLRVPNWMRPQLPAVLNRRSVRYLLAFVLFWSAMALLSYAFTFLPLVYLR